MMGCGPLVCALLCQCDALMPVVCLDPMLPGQRLDLVSTDRTLGQLVRSVGAGGSLGMIGIDNREKRLRRHGVEVVVETCGDAPPDGPDAPPGVRATLSATRRLRVLGTTPIVGRWRRCYAEDDFSDSRATALGWGRESFVRDDIVELAKVDEAADQATAARNSDKAGVDDDAVAARPWTPTPIMWVDDDAADDVARAAETATAIAALEPLITRWKQLIVARSEGSDEPELAAGRTSPGLRSSASPSLAAAAGRTPRRAAEPAAPPSSAALVLERVLVDIGPMPAATRPHSFALWAAALVNPLPPLGVAPEVRPAVLRAQGALARLEVVRRAFERSIANLDGSRPI